LFHSSKFVDKNCHTNDNRQESEKQNNAMKQYSAIVATIKQHEPDLAQKMMKDGLKPKIPINPNNTSDEKTKDLPDVLSLS